MMPGKKIYFVSDAHLGLPNYDESLVREKLLVKWLDEIKTDAEEIYLLGDIFDFWFEYKKVVPKGFTRFMGKIAEITDSGIPVHYILGNHDLWIFDYLPKETGAKIYRAPIEKTFNGKKFYLAHGDGLGPKDKQFKFLKKIFVSPFFQWLFSVFHPGFGVGIAHKWSHSSRKIRFDYTYKAENEWLYQYSQDVLKKEHFDYFIYGHRHIPFRIHLNEKSEMINTGDWLKNFSYLVFDGEKIEDKKYKIKEQ